MDTWWQTETGHILITPLPGITTMKPGSAQQPFPGVRPEIRDDEGNQLEVEQTGNLVLTQPWPGMMRSALQRRPALPRDLLVEVLRRVLRR